MKEETTHIMADCIICHSPTNEVVDQQLKLTFYHCPNCEFIYQDPTSHVDKNLEKSQYDHHQNSFQNQGYVDYLKNFLDEEVLPVKDTGIALDFGSGPGPVLYELMKGHFTEVRHYDPFYHPDESYIDVKFDVITSTEVVEHFSDPLKEFSHLKELLKDEGYLFIMTNFRTMDLDEFLTWWYRRDSTHISFYHLKTFEEICSKTGLKIVSHNKKNVIILKRA
jgi:SAM-dependent methyltransferase